MQHSPSVSREKVNESPMRMTRKKRARLSMEANSETNSTASGLHAPSTGKKVLPDQPIDISKAYSQVCVIDF